jgi:hypothetical protein
MARHQNITGQNYKFTDPVYDMLDPADVNANPDNYVLMCRTVHAKVDGKMVASEDRRYARKADQRVRESKGWQVVSLTMAEKAQAAPSPKAKK